MHAPGTRSGLQVSGRPSSIWGRNEEPPWSHATATPSDRSDVSQGSRGCHGKVSARRMGERYLTSPMKRRGRPDPDALFAASKPRRALPFDFVLAELEELGPFTRPMFGCHAIYVEDKIVFILRDKGDPREDDGVWVATTVEHHRAL